MSRYTILTKRILSEATNLNTDYIKALHLSVKTFPGFIKGTSYWKGTESIVTISHWKSHHDWNKWLTSEERLHVSMHYNHMIREEHHEELYEIVKCNNTFLL